MAYFHQHHKGHNSCKPLIFNHQAIMPAATKSLPHRYAVNAEACIHELHSFACSFFHCVACAKPWTTKGNGARPLLR